MNSNDADWAGMNPAFHRKPTVEECSGIVSAASVPATAQDVWDLKGELAHKLIALERRILQLEQQRVKHHRPDEEPPANKQPCFGDLTPGKMYTATCVEDSYGNRNAPQPPCVPPLPDHPRFRMARDRPQFRRNENWFDIEKMPSSGSIEACCCIARCWWLDCSHGGSDVVYCSNLRNACAWRDYYKARVKR